MLKNKMMYAICSLSFLLFVGCRVQTEYVGTEKELTGNIEEIKQNNFQKIEYTNMPMDMYGFAAGEDGMLYVLMQDGTLQQYTINGEPLRFYSDCMDFTAFCYADKMLYAYDAVKREIVAIDIETAEKSTVIENFAVEEVLKMIVLDDALYVLIVPEQYQAFGKEDEYVSFEESLYKITLEEGKKEQLSIDGILAIYKDGRERLYYYAYQDETYVLGEYDTETGEGRICYDMMKQFGVRYLSAFVYEQDKFAYAEITTPRIQVISLTGGMELGSIEEVLLFSGNDMECVRGNILYLGYHPEERGNTLQGIYLGDFD